MSHIERTTDDDIAIVTITGPSDLHAGQPDLDELRRRRRIAAECGRVTAAPALGFRRAPT
jgi:hypothetical protein